MNGKEAAPSAAGVGEPSATTTPPGGVPAVIPAGGVPADVPAGARELAALIDSIEAGIDAWAQATTEWLSGQSKPTGTAIDKFIRPAVARMLHEPGSRLAGAGFVAVTGLLGHGRSYIAWWQGEDLERVDALANFSPSSISRYVKTEWFKVPVETGRPHVTGPYIDLLCTDEYVLTFTNPVFSSGTIAGVVGMDVTAQTLERAGLASLRSLGPGAVLVNAGGRAIVSASPTVDAGDLVQAAPEAAIYPVGRQFRIITHTV
ncbi:cache domain-containing protein [Arthrobacter sp. A2-55]|uniref:cache domain-containing protein n=1 Tax=Arthrobacter sp. A2-55 TaxID=2897337 RepID=UPI0021CD3D6A|nr:cache domain-containing protein [Arthrobacter sp. A2-55]MCU6481986.1 cache domain-containing protein [Arthrobacter sp. A2-55]